MPGAARAEAGVIATWFLLAIGVLPHPPDPNYLCLMVTRPLGMAVLCAPGAIRVWTGVCHQGDRCPN